MSRSGYSDDFEMDWAGIMYRGSVKSALRGKRGQKALKEIVAALDAMPEKALCAESLTTKEGEYCTLGALGLARGIDMSAIDPEDWEAVADAFNIAPAMVREIVFENDECGEVFEPSRGTYGSYRQPTPQERWMRMRKWIFDQIKPED